MNKDCIFINGKCTQCGRKLPHGIPSDVRWDCPIAKDTVVQQVVTTGGPGKEMELLLKELDIHPKVGCPCHEMARQMNVWGVEGCRKHFDYLVEYFRTHIKDYSWVERFKAAAMAVKTRLVLELDLLNPVPSLINMAIRRAETKEKATSSPIDDS